MEPTRLLAVRAVSRQQWSGLGLALGLGALLLAALFAAVRPGRASAAEAAIYSCDQPGLNNAVAAGGSATFACAATTTVTVTTVKVINKNVSLDGGNKLILKASPATGVFTVAAGVHLSLLNLTVRDAISLSFGAIYNNGLVALTHTQFLKNTAVYGAVLFNAPGARATIFDSTIDNNNGEGGVVWNGSTELTATVPATLTVSSTKFETNSASAGAAILNQAGLVSVSGSTFLNNYSNTGGAVFNFGTLHVTGSTFSSNFATLGFEAQAAALGSAGLGRPAGISLFETGAGGAIYAGAEAHTTVGGSTFVGNLSEAGGGAIAFGFLPPAFTEAAASDLSIADSTFQYNCSGGPGGAVANGMAATVSNSSFQNNSSDSSADPCIAENLDLENLSGLAASGSAPAGIGPSNLPGAGGAIFNSGLLAVNGSSFLHNSASVTVAGGGGAIANYFAAGLTVGSSTFSDNFALQDGGAIYNDIIANATVVGSGFTHNFAMHDSGGAVASRGVLTVTNSLFTRNHGAPHLGQLSGGGGAIYSSGGAIAALLPEQANDPSRATGPAQAPEISGPSNRLYVDHTSFISNASEYEGGAIDAGAALIHASTFASNTAAYGGALDVLADDFVVDSSTFNANAAVSTTLHVAVEGGAIDANGEAMSVINSTFYRNFVPAGAAGGAIQADDGLMAITNSTFISNTALDGGSGGGLAGNASASAHNVLLAFNSGGNCQALMTLNGANLEFPGTTCGGASVQANPRALVPANNGGPTFTSALLAGSPAINAGSNSGCPSADQRGAARVGVCDIGAYEFGGMVARLWLPLVRK